MRLTLRTMLAYLDDVLDPADAETLKKKIEESDFASGLVARIRGVLKKLRMDAPKLDGKGMGNDANTVAEYLDSALTQDRVAEFERVCLESDKHLSEAASCHQILTIVLGKPADVPPDLRDRIYLLGNPDRAQAHATQGAAAAAPAPALVPPPVPAGNGKPVQRPAPLEVPEYLRAGRSSSVWPLLGFTAATLLLGLIALLALGPFDKDHPVAKLLAGRQAVAEVPSEPAAPSDIAPKTDEKTPATATDTAPAATDTAPSSPAAPAPAESVAAVTAAPYATTQPATTDVPPPESPDKSSPDKSSPDKSSPDKSSPDKVIVATPLSPTPSVPAVPETPDTIVPPAPAVAVTPKLPTAKLPSSDAPPKPKPADVGRYTSDGQILATLDPNDGLWYVKQPQEILSAGEHLVVLPAFRPQIALPSAVQLEFASESAFRMEEPGENRIPRVSIAYGRFLVRTAGKAGAQVELDLAGVKGLLTLVDADSDLAIKLARWVPPGEDPEAAPGLLVIEMYNANGRVIWQQGETKFDIPARHVHVYVGTDPPETHGPFFSPEWIDRKSVKSIDREAAAALEKLVDFDRPLNLSLQELTTKERHVRSLAARCLAALGEFEPILRELSDGNQYSFWPSEFETLQHALSRSPETAAKVRQTLGLLRSVDSKELYRLLWGYSEEQLAQGAAGQLVKLLEHDQMDMRVLAYSNLVSITGVWGFYRPERAPAQMKTAIQNWKDRKDKHTIIYRLPPSPLDTYKPINAPGADAKAGGK
jgi:hypothetical protein